MRRWNDVLLLPVFMAALMLSGFVRTASAADESFTGVVVDDKVEARAGASPTFYVVGSVPKGTRVNVAKLVEGWFQVEPTEGMYSYISKAFVDAKGDGKTGVVNSEKPEKRTDVNAVKAAAADPSDYSYKFQVQLSKGDTVQIVAEDGSNYKIVPPKGAYVFLRPGSVRKSEGGATTVTPAPAPTPKPEPVKAAEPKPAPAPTPKPEVKHEPVEVEPKPAPAPKPTNDDLTPAQKATELPKVEPKPTPVVEAPAPKPAPAPAPVPTSDTPRSATPDSAALKAAEARLQEAGKLPLSKQPLDQLLATYQGLAGDTTLSWTDRRIIAIRSAQIKDNIDRAKGLKEIEEVQAQSTTPIDPKPAQAPTVTNYSPNRYDLVGQLLASGVYDGETGPRLFRLVEPASMRTLAYVQYSTKFNARQCLGQIVGIIGSTRYDPALKLRVVDVKTMEILAAAGGQGEAPTDPAAPPKKAEEMKPVDITTPAPAPNASTTQPAMSVTVVKTAPSSNAATTQPHVVEMTPVTAPKETKPAEQEMMK